MAGCILACGLVGGLGSRGHQWAEGLGNASSLLVETYANATLPVWSVHGPQLVPPCYDRALTPWPREPSLRSS